MVYRRKKRKRAKRKSTRRKSASKRTRKAKRSRPIGYTKVKGKGYALVFGTRAKPKLGRGRYKSKSGLKKAAAKYFKK